MGRKERAAAQSASSKQKHRRRITFIDLTSDSGKTVVDLTSDSDDTLIGDHHEPYDPMDLDDNDQDSRLQESSLNQQPIIDLPHQDRVWDADEPSEEAPLPDGFDLNDFSLRVDGEGRNKLFEPESVAEEDEGEGKDEGEGEGEGKAEGEAEGEAEGTIPETEKCAENGWITIRETPLAPYDCDEDPAGLYGGREVDDRGGLMEYYHRDAHDKQIFAKMAPTREELVVAEKEAKAKKEAEERYKARTEAEARANASEPIFVSADEFSADQHREKWGLQTPSPPKKQILKLRGPTRRDPDPTLPRVEGLELDSISGTAAQGNQTRSGADDHRRAQEMLAPVNTPSHTTKAAEALQKWQKGGQKSVRFAEEEIAGEFDEDEMQWAMVESMEALKDQSIPGVESTDTDELPPLERCPDRKKQSKGDLEEERQIQEAKERSVKEQNQSASKRKRNDGPSPLVQSMSLDELETEEDSDAEEKIAIDEGSPRKKNKAAHGLDGEMKSEIEGGDVMDIAGAEEMSGAADVEAEGEAKVENGSDGGADEQTDGQ